MNRTWLVFEKIFAAVEIVLAMFLLWSLYYEINLWEDILYMSKSKPSFWHLLINQQSLVVVDVLFLSGGLLFFFRKKAGWVISTSLWIYYCIIGIPIALFEHQWNKSDFYKIPLMILWFVLLLPLIQKPILNKYKINKTDWAITAILVILISLDANWKYLF